MLTDAFFLTPSLTYLDDLSIGYGFVEFPNHEIAKNVFMTLNGKQIPNSIRNYKLNWASHGTSRHH